MDLQRGDSDESLESYLQAAFDQAQAPPPFGCGRLLIPDPAPDDNDQDTAPVVTRDLPVSSTGAITVPDARHIASVTVDGTPITAYRSLIRDGVTVALDVTEFPDSTIPAQVQIAGRFGIWPLPENLRDAIYVLAARYYFEANAQFADQVALTPDGGGQAYYRQLPPRAKLVFSGYTVARGVGDLL